MHSCLCALLRMGLEVSEEFDEDVSGAVDVSVKFRSTIWTFEDLVSLSVITTPQIQFPLYLSLLLQYQ